VERLSSSPADPGIWAAIAWIAVWASAIWGLRDQRRWTLFALGWFLAALLPVLQLVPHPTVRADRYLYSAMLGPLLVFVLVLEKRPDLFKIVGLASAIALAGCTLARIPAWQNGRTLWTDSVTKNPRSAMGHYSLAGCLIADHDWQGAEAHARQAVELNPRFADGQERLGTILLVLNHPIEAREHLERALALNPQLPDARHNLELILHNSNTQQ
jgi:tetratricopeptide (TPR) repeat protein